MFHMTILGKHDWYLPTQKVAQQWLQGYVLLFGGSEGGPHGDRW